jgi:Haem-degrading
MANVVKKHSISYELAQKMENEAVVKARELGVSENVAILDDGGNLKAFSRMDGAPIPTIEIALNKAYTALSASPRRAFSTLFNGTRRFWPASPRFRVWRRGEEGFDQGGWRNCWGNWGEWGARSAERHRLRGSSPCARV